MAKEKKSDLRKKREAIAKHELRQRAASGQMPADEQEKILKADDRSFARKMIDKFFGRDDKPLHDDKTFNEFAARNDNDTPGMDDGDEEQPGDEQAEDVQHPFTEATGDEGPGFFEASGGQRQRMETYKVKRRIKGEKSPFANMGKPSGKYDIQVQQGDLPDDAVGQEAFNSTDSAGGGVGGESPAQLLQKIYDDQQEMRRELPREVKEELFSE
jgi:hypothetical protein